MELAYADTKGIRSKSMIRHNHKVSESWKDLPWKKFRTLKAGTNPNFPEQGTPQGGVVSPLLANIALNGIEEIHPSTRYADDMVYFLKPTDNIVECYNQISPIATCVYFAPNLRRQKV
jgi:hypothetical protein